eukprot:jgi/Bigna1/136172/aug1.32_g10880
MRPVGENQVLIFPPLASKQSMQEKLLVLIPGANVATEYYSAPALAIQDKAQMKLWVVVPAMPEEKCIIACPTKGFCSILQNIVQKAIKQAIDQGYAGGTAAPDVLMSGHSLGGTCASSLVEAYEKTAQKYQALVVMGSYVTDQAVEGFSTPVLTLGAELDGGLGRPGNILTSLESSDKAALAEGELNSKWQLTNKPVSILPKLDHSSFCPGFRVPGDVYPADTDNATAMTLISHHVASFLHLHTPQPKEIVDDSVSVLEGGMRWTREELLRPYTEALALELSRDGKTAPWCAVAQDYIAGLKHRNDSARLHIAHNTYTITDSNFEHSRVKYLTRSDELYLNISAHDAPYGTGPTGIATSCLRPSLEVGCKLASADRIAEQLRVPSSSYTNTSTCMDINNLALKTAFDLLNRTEAGRSAIARYHKRGRGVCLEKDHSPLGNIGPLFVKGRLSIKDNGTCLVVSSMSLGPTPLKSLLFPGVQYCKLLSPARIMDYIMIDSLKSKSGCLNVGP